MKILLLLSLCVTAALSKDGVVAGECKETECKIEAKCRCSNGKSPIGNLNDYPQLISLTFDEAVTVDLIATYWEPLLYSRINPDKIPIGATFFVPHEYTDYTKVNELYTNGFEIGVHSITKNPLQTYWRNATEQLLEQEFGGQRQIISRFANIPIADIIGVRTPQLQLAGNYSIKAYANANLSYDSSWPTLPTKPLFPYTLNYLTTQQCTLGSKCPNEAFDGFWVLPINDLNGNEKECNVLGSCGVNGTADTISDWLVNEIDLIRNSTKAPLTLLVNSAWFDFTENSLKGFTSFLDAMATRKDVFFVSQKQVLEWIKAPTKLSNFTTDFPDNRATCNDITCDLKDQNNTERYFSSCVACPAKYPWLGNPNGDAI